MENFKSAFFIILLLMTSFSYSKKINNNKISNTQVNLPNSNQTSLIKNEYKIPNKILIEKKVAKLLSKKPKKEQTPEVDEIELENIHNPYKVPETQNMRNISFIIITCFGFAYLLLRMITSCLKPKKWKFLAKAVKILTNQSLYYFIFVSLVDILYTYGVFDSLKINWEYLIASLCIFGIGWYFFSFFIIILCTLASFKWKELEINSKDSFSNIKLIFRIYKRKI